MQICIDGQENVEHKSLNVKLTLTCEGLGKIWANSERVVVTEGFMIIRLKNVIENSITHVN